MTAGVAKTIRIGIGMGTLCAWALVAGGRPAYGAADQGAWGQDPFGTPPGLMDGPGAGDPPAPDAPAELQGIIAGPGGMVAIVDSHIVRIGDWVGAARVVEITPRAVVLQQGSHTRRLVMPVIATRGQ